MIARQNSIWRRFDLLWMLHIMDYRERDDINTTVLRIASVLGLATVLSGYALWVTSTLYARRKRG